METKYEPWLKPVGNMTLELKSLLSLAPPPHGPLTALLNYNGHTRTSKQLVPDITTEHDSTIMGGEVGEYRRYIRFNFTDIIDQRQFVAPK